MKEFEPWQITWRGAVYSSEHVTTSQMIAVAVFLASDSWDALDPWGGPRRLAAWVCVLSGKTEEVLTAPASEVLAALQRRG